MKTRSSFVTNSSSTAFVIVNKSVRPRTATDFVRENERFIKEFVQWYLDTYHVEITRDDILRSAADHRFTFPPEGSDGEMYIEVSMITWTRTLFAEFLGFVVTTNMPSPDSLLFKWEDRWVSE